LRILLFALTILVGLALALGQVGDLRTAEARVGEILAARGASVQASDSPEQAVRAYYAALARGDFQAAYLTWSETLRASIPFERFAAGFATTRTVEVEEARLYGGWSWSAPEAREAVVYVRLTAVDERDGTAVSSHFAGTWTLQREPAGWLLAEPNIQPAPSLEQLQAALPSEAAIEMTAQGDLQGLGRADLALVVELPDDLYFSRVLVLLATATGWEQVDLTELEETRDVLATFPQDLRIQDVNGDGRAELVVGGGAGAHDSSLSILRWESGRFVVLGQGSTNTPGLDLRDLDQDRVAEVVFPYSSYCGGYVASPAPLVFALRWQGTRYLPATLDYPDLNGPETQASIRERIEGQEASSGLSRGEEALPCLYHSLATLLAMQGQPNAARAAYQRYAALWRDDEPWPHHVGIELFTSLADDLLARAEAGRLGSWSTPELAFLDDLIGNSQEAKARRADFEAEWRAGRGDTTGAAESRAAAENDRAAAAAAYRSALQRNPNDQEAQRALRRLAPAGQAGPIDIGAGRHG
jgi:hypothetical protein